MSRLRRLALVLMAVAVVVSGVYYTGAFTTLTAQRDANVRVAGDAGGYLALAPANGSNGAYATQRNGELRVSLDGALTEGASGTGVNPDAVTTVRRVFTITNRVLRAYLPTKSCLYLFIIQQLYVNSILAR